MAMNAVEQIYTKCLAQGSYFIESDGEAAVIDPLREPGPYLERAKERGVKIKYIFETHFHADFVSGHLDLAAKTGATIIYGPTAKTDFEKYEARDNELFKLGKLTFKALHTPGHTPESTTYLLRDEEGKDHAIFTGDTLFIGDVGRPDLAQKAANMTEEQLAGMLYHSLRTKLMPLDDKVLVYPAHGAGSSCGKSMSKETWDTLGNQKKVNYALRADMTEKEFIAEVTEGLMAPPQYFAENVRLNRTGYDQLDKVYSEGLKALSLDDFDKLRKDESVLVLDVRDKNDFVKGHIPDSIFIGLDGTFAPWVGALITDINQKIALVVPEGREEEAVKRLARVGYDNTIGYIEGGYAAWQKSGRESANISTLDIDKFIAQAGSSTAKIIDVRKPSEYNTASLDAAISMPLDFFPETDFNVLDKKEPYLLHCQSGFRATVATSILKKYGYHNFTNVIGSFNTVKESKLAVSGSCPTLL